MNVVERKGSGCVRGLAGLGLALVIVCLATPVHALNLPVTDDLVLWLKADEGLDTTTVGSDVLVDTWYDQPAGGQNTTANNGTASGGNRPALVANASPNGYLPMLRFDNGPYLQIADHADLDPGTGGFTIFVAGKRTGTDTSSRGWLSKQASGSSSVGYSIWSTIEFTKTNVSISGGSTTTRGSQTHDRADGFQVLTMLADGSEVFGFLNGSSAGWTDGGGGPPDNDYSGDVSNTRALQIGRGYGGGYPLSGDIGEVIIYKDALSAAERQQVENYLRCKWSWTIDRRAPVAHYQFDEPSGNTILDSSPNVLHGTLGASPQNPARVPGISGGALDFSTATEAVGQASSLYAPYGGAPISFAAWINPDTITTASMGTDENRIFTTYRSTSWGSQLFAGLGESADGGQSGKFLLSFYPYYNYKSTALISTTDGWHQVAFTYDGTEAIVYIDGVEDGRFTSTYHDPSSLDMRIGATYYPGYGGAYRSFDGLIDDVQFYAGALDPCHVLYLYDHPGAVLYPEPSTMALAVMGGLALVRARRRRRAK